MNKAVLSNGKVKVRRNKKKKEVFLSMALVDVINVDIPAEEFDDQNEEQSKQDRSSESEGSGSEDEEGLDLKSLKEQVEELIEPDKRNIVSNVIDKIALHINGYNTAKNKVKKNSKKALLNALNEFISSG
jgi:hypothetical protein